MDLLFAALASLTTSLPVLVVWTVGMGLAVAHLRRRRLSSLLLLAGLATLTVLRIVTGVVFAVGPVVLSQRGVAVAQIGQLMGTASLLGNLGYAVAWSLVLGAVFVREGEPSGVTARPL